MALKRFVEIISQTAKETRYINDSSLNPSNIFAECNPEETTVLLHWPGNIYLSYLHKECIITERSFSANILSAYKIADNEERITNMQHRKHDEHV